MNIGGVRLTKSENENIQDLPPGGLDTLSHAPLILKPQQTQVVLASGLEEEFTAKLFTDSNSPASSLTLSKMIEDDYFKVPG